MGAVVVTGGASGLGAVIAEAIVAVGRPVVLVDRDEEAAERLTARLGPLVSWLRADLTDTGEVRRVAEAVLAREDVDALVNDAGGWLPGPQYPDPSADWQAALTLNLVAPMLLTQLLWTTLDAVVTIGSSGGIGDEPYGSPEYGAAKAGVRRFTRSLGSRADVRVMAVVPGWIGLVRAHAEWSALSEAEQREVGRLIPPGRVADAVLRLLDRGMAGEVVELLRGAEP